MIKIVAINMFRVNQDRNVILTNTRKQVFRKFKQFPFSGKYVMVTINLKREYCASI